jgi:hypothetical protein
MTPAEFSLFVDAAREREEQQWERAAWMVHHMYGMQPRKKGSKPPTVDKLLGRKKKPRTEA